MMNTPEDILRRDDPIAGEAYEPEGLDAMLDRVTTSDVGRQPGRSWRLGSKVAVGVALTMALGGAFFSGARLASASSARHDQPVCNDSNGMPNWPTAQAASKLDSSLESSFSSIYAGVVVSDCNAVITIYETVVSPQLGAAAAAVAPPGSLHFDVVPNSLAQLLAVQRSLEAAWLSLKSQGIEVQGFGTDVPSNLETVQVTNPTSSQITQLQNEFGAGLIQVESVPPNFVTPLGSSTQ
jgi:hypothetical protein